MEVICRGPFRAGTLVWQPRPGAFALTVVCKATFVLAPGESPFHVEPADVEPSDVHHEGNPQKSLAQAADLVPIKKHAELLVTGHAYAPGGIAVKELVLRVAFGEIDKRIAVLGDSFIALDNTLSSPEPWTKMPLRWELTSAGPEAPTPLNPVGVRMGRGARADTRGRVALPNLRPVNATLASRWDVLPPVGFSPIAVDWHPRRARATAAAGVDPAFFNAAPEGQLFLQSPEITGEEELCLENLLPGAPRLTTRLARVTPRAHAELHGGGRAVIDLRCDTLSIHTDLGVATLVWRGHAEIAHPEALARVVVAGQAMTSVLVPAAEPPRTLSVRETIGLAGALPGFVLPFANERPLAPTPEVAAPPPTPESVAPPPTPVVVAPPPTPVLVAPPPTPESVAPESDSLHDLETLRPSRAHPAPDPPESPEPPEPVFQEPFRPTLALSSFLRGDEPPSLPFQPSTPDLDEYPLEDCARIAAEIACHPESEPSILHAHGLSIAGWESLSAHWTSAIQAESLRDRQDLLTAYDAAYVEAIESERGPISPGDYASLVVAERRGVPTTLLDALSIPYAALPRIRRAILRKSVKDPAFALEIRAALRVASAQ